MSTGPVALGKTCTIMDLCPTAAGSDTRDFSIESDSVLISLFVESVSGTLDVTIQTLTEEGKSLNIITFPTVSAPTADLLLRKAAAAMSRIRVTAVYSGAAKFEVRAKGISAGELNTKILASENARASQKDVTTSATLIIPAAITDRDGMVLKNNNSSGTMYVGFSIAEATLLNGYPIGPQEALGLDVASGVTVYGISDSITIDVRILEAGN